MFQFSLNNANAIYSNTLNFKLPLESELLNLALLHKHWQCESKHQVKAAPPFVWPAKERS